MCSMQTNDVDARLAALQARRRPAGPSTARPSTQRTNAITGRPRRHHPARKARIATRATSVVAMFGITGFMASHDASSAATSAGSTSAATSRSSLTASLTKTSLTGTTTAATAATATTKAQTTTKGS